MKGKILDSQYNPGYDSWVLKETKYGTFDAHVELQEEDTDIENSFDGCRFAEYKCDLQAMKEKAKWMRQRAIGISSAYDILAMSESEDDPVMIKLQRQAAIAWREARAARELYDRLKINYSMMISTIGKQRREARKKFE